MVSSVSIPKASVTSHPCSDHQASFSRQNFPLGNRAPGPAPGPALAKLWEWVEATSLESKDSVLLRRGWATSEPATLISSRSLCKGSVTSHPRSDQPQRKHSRVSDQPRREAALSLRAAWDGANSHPCDDFTGAHFCSLPTTERVPLRTGSRQGSAARVCDSCARHYGDYRTCTSLER